MLQLLSIGLSKSEMLDVHPLELCFLLDAKKYARCIVNITNRTDRYVAYWILPEFSDMYRCLDYQHIMEPMSTDASDVIMVVEQLPLDAGMFNILIIAMVSKRDLEALISSIGNDPKIDGLLERVEELGGEVHAATLTTAVEEKSPERDNAAAMVSSFNPPVGI